MNRILVVDDDRTTRHVLQSVLNNAGFSASAAKDGVEALAALRAEPFDLLLLDVWMPRMTVCKCSRNSAAARHVRASS